MGNVAMSAYYPDDSGWRVLNTDYLGGYRVLIAKNNYNFAWVNHSRDVKTVSIFGPNNNGDLFCHYRTGTFVSDESLLVLNRPSFNLTQAMRNSGARTFGNKKVNMY